ncbi:MAG TPA: glycosyltransferase family 4 protein [Candidatus Acidoferrales bacterium]|nr:glycosyltransferase family 4 protein [Candidatus Acidoferrales bacterium]
MRIAQVAPLYESVPPRFYGGTERVVSWLTETLVSLGHDVTLFASGDSVTNARLVPACKKALRLDANCVDPFAHHILMIENVFRHADDFDLIHFHVDYLHFLRSRREQVACATTLHGRLDLPDLVPLYQEFREIPLISISDAQRRPLPWVNWLGTVRHGMPSTLLNLHDRQGKYLAFLGRVSPEKGLEQAIEIAIRSEMTLKIAAKIDRADREYFEARIKRLLDHPLVDFVGEIGNDEKEEFLGNAAALLFPIQWPEPFGLVMIESLACGTPVIACPSGSVPEIILDGRCGFIVRTIEQAVKAVRKIGEIDRRNCRRHFERNFTADRMAGEYLSIYERLIHPESDSITEKGVLTWLEVESPTPSTT